MTYSSTPFARSAAATNVARVVVLIVGLFLVAAATA